MILACYNYSWIEFIAPFILFHEDFWLEGSNRLEKGIDDTFDRFSYCFLFYCFHISTKFSSFCTDLCPLWDRKSKKYQFIKQVYLSNYLINVYIILIKITENLPDALENECSPCSEKQKEIADKVVQFLIDNKPEIWVVLEAKYDPTGAYRQHYLQNRVKEESD